MSLVSVMGVIVRGGREEDEHTCPVVPCKVLHPLCRLYHPMTTGSDATVWHPQ